MTNTTTIATLPNSHERLAATVAHAGTALAWFLAPLLVYFVVPRDSRWARFHALQSLLWSLAGTLLGLCTFGIAIPVFLAWHVYAAIKTMQGVDYEYPLVGKVAHDVVFNSTSGR